MRGSRGVSTGFRLLAVALAAVALLTGCGGGSGTDAAETTAAKEETTAPEEEETAAEKAEKLYSLYAPAAREGCKRERPPGDVYIALDGWETPETAGIVVATERGYFKRLGLTAYAFARPNPGSVIPEVVEGLDDVGIAHEPEVVLAKENGSPIVILGSLIPQPTAALIWLKDSKIGGISDLKGKTIGIQGLPFQEMFLEKALADGGLSLSDVKVESLGYKLVQELVSGHIDAMLGRPNLQGAELEARGLGPVVTPLRDLGIPAYEEFVLIARPDCVSKRPRMFRDFLSAFARGTDAVVENPDGALGLIMDDTESNPETSRKAMDAQLKATLPLISQGGDASRAKLRGLVDWMHEEGMIQRKVPVGSLLSVSR